MNENFSVVESSVNGIKPFDVYMYDIGQWDMSAIGIKSISYDSGISREKVILVSVMITNDSETENLYLSLFPLDADSLVSVDDTTNNVEIALDYPPVPVSIFDTNSGDFDSTATNRGVVTFFVLR